MAPRFPSSTVPGMARALLAALALLGAGGADAAVTIVINNTDPAGAGFNDSTPAAPVGGNAGTTIGQQRLNAFQFAAGLWASRLTSAVPINVDAKFGPLTPCTPTGGVIGSAGPTAVRSFATDRVVPGPPTVTVPANTWVAEALGEKLQGSNANGTTADINASFNGNIGTSGCLTSVSWYLGLDGNPPVNTVDFVSVLLHELGHGLGFLTFVDITTGARLSGKDDVFMLNLHDNAAALQWPALSDAQRQSSVTNTNQVVWTGPAVATAAGSITSGRDGAGHPEVFTPNPAQSGSSVSHWTQHAGLPNACASCDELFPIDLMKPAYTIPTHSTFITHLALQDIGWGPVASGSGSACTGGELLTDNGFEAGQAPSGGTGSSGTSGPWGWTSDGGNNPVQQPSGSSPIPTHAGSWYAWLDGYGSAHTETIFQQTSIPTGSTATLTFFLMVRSNETGSTVKDTLDVQVMDASGGTELQRLARFSNVDKSGSYAQKTFDLSAFAGQTVRIQFKGIEDASTATGFFVDDVSLAVTCSSSTFTLRVAKAGIGSGTVTSDTGGISCGSACSATYAGGSSVVLTAAPAGGSTFSGWSGAGCSGTGTCTVPVTQDQNVTATFAVAGSGTPLVLAGGRVSVSVDWQSQYSGQAGHAVPIPQQDGFGFYYFTDPGNPEVFVKVLDFGQGGALCFVGGLSDFHYAVTFKTLRTGQTLVFDKPAGQYVGFADNGTLRFARDGFTGRGTEASAGWALAGVLPLEDAGGEGVTRIPVRTAAPSALAVPQSLTLSQGRVQVIVEWRSQYNGQSGTAFAIPQQDGFGFFYFTDPGNPEVFVKVLDFGQGGALCFVGGLSDFYYKVTFKTLRTGQTLVFEKQPGQYLGFADNGTLRF